MSSSDEEETVVVRSKKVDVKVGRKAASAPAVPEQARPSATGVRREGSEGADGPPSPSPCAGAEEKKRRTANPGVRVHGGRVYDSENGTTCHQCRQKTAETKAKCGVCTLYFCPRCLENRYSEIVAEVNALPDWSCPRCRGDCNCSACRRKAGLGATGILSHISKRAGFGSVSDLLASNPHARAPVVRTAGGGDSEGGGGGGSGGQGGSAAPPDLPARDGFALRASHEAAQQAKAAKKVAERAAREAERLAEKREKAEAREGAREEARAAREAAKEAARAAREAAREAEKAAREAAKEAEREAEELAREASADLSGPASRQGSSTLPPGRVLDSALPPRPTELPEPVRSGALPAPAWAALAETLAFLASFWEPLGLRGLNAAAVAEEVTLEVDRGAEPGGFPALERFHEALMPLLPDEEESDGEESEESESEESEESELEGDGDGEMSAAGLRGKPRALPAALLSLLDDSWQAAALRRLARAEDEGKRYLAAGVAEAIRSAQASQGTRERRRGEGRPASLAAVAYAALPAPARVHSLHELALDALDSEALRSEVESQMARHAHALREARARASEARAEARRQAARARDEEIALLIAGAGPGGLTLERQRELVERARVGAETRAAETRATLEAALPAEPMAVRVRPLGCDRDGRLYWPAPACGRLGGSGSFPLVAGREGDLGADDQGEASEGRSDGSPSAGEQAAPLRLLVAGPAEPPRAPALAEACLGCVGVAPAPFDVGMLEGTGPLDACLGALDARGFQEGSLRAVLELCRGEKGGFLLPTARRQVGRLPPQAGEDTAEEAGGGKPPQADRAAGRAGKTGSEGRPVGKAGAPARITRRGTAGEPGRRRTAPPAPSSDEAAAVRAAAQQREREARLEARARSAEAPTSVRPPVASLLSRLGKRAADGSDECGAAHAKVRGNLPRRVDDLIPVSA